MQIGQVQHFSARLRRVPHDYNLAGDVRAGHEVVQRTPTQHFAGLLLQGKLRQVIGVDEQVHVRLEERAAAFEETPVPLWDVGQASAPKP